MGYVVRSTRDTGTITYHCPSIGSAVDKFNEFQRAEYREITVTGCDERQVSRAQLAELLDSERAQADLTQACHA